VRKFGWKVVELWDDLHYPGRRQTLRTHMCAFGLHWPISFGDVGGGAYQPPDSGWSCEMCGHERLPYRAVWWPIRDIPIRIAIWRDERRAA
jgi:hypothetical protein